MPLSLSSSFPRHDRPLQPTTAADFPFWGIIYLLINIKFDATYQHTFLSTAAFPLWIAPSTRLQVLLVLQTFKWDVPSLSSSTCNFLFDIDFRFLLDCPFCKKHDLRIGSTSF